MGSPKMLLMFKGRTMIENVIENIAGSEIENILVVLGSGREKITGILEKMKVKYCYNNNYNEGMLSSVQCGFRNLPSDFEAAMVFQGDQPLITPLTINMVNDAYRSSGKGIVIPVYKKKRGHPLLINRKYTNEIENLNTREGLRSLAYQFPDDVKEVDTDDPGILRDFDTFEEYYNEINQKH